MGLPPEAPSKREFGRGFHVGGRRSLTGRRNSGAPSARLSARGAASSGACAAVRGRRHRNSQRPPRPIPVTIPSSLSRVWGSARPSRDAPHGRDQRHPRRERDQQPAQPAHLLARNAEHKIGSPPEHPAQRHHVQAPAGERPSRQSPESRSRSTDCCGEEDAQHGAQGDEVQRIEDHKHPLPARARNSLCSRDATQDILKVSYRNQGNPERRHSEGQHRHSLEQGSRVPPGARHGARISRGWALPAPERRGRECERVQPPTRLDICSGTEYRRSSCRPPSLSSTTASS